MQEAPQLLQGQTEQQLLYGRGLTMQALTHRTSQLPMRVRGDSQDLQRMMLT